MSKKVEEFIFLLKSLPKILKESSVTSSKFWKDEEVDALIEDIDPEHQHSAECGPEGEGDEVDAAIEDIIAMLVSNEYEEEDAKEAVFDALHNLIKRDELSDTPETIEESSTKDSWISEFNVKIRNELKKLGLDFEG